jgi:hypothetical protein
MTSFPLAASYRLCGKGRGGPQGASGARCGLRYDRVGRCRKAKSEGKKGREEKRRGTSLYTWRRAGLADEGQFHAMLDAAGGEGGRGVAKPQGVVHRYALNRRYRFIVPLALRTAVCPCQPLYPSEFPRYRMSISRSDNRLDPVSFKTVIRWTVPSPPCSGISLTRIQI